MCSTRGGKGGYTTPPSRGESVFLRGCQIYFFFAIAYAKKKKNYDRQHPPKTDTLTASRGQKRKENLNFFPLKQLFEKLGLDYFMKTLQIFVPESPVMTIDNFPRFTLT